MWSMALNGVQVELENEILSNTGLSLFQSLTGGTVNRTLRVVYNGDYTDGFIFRINGTVGENVSRLMNIWLWMEGGRG